MRQLSLKKRMENEFTHLADVLRFVNPNAFDRLKSDYLSLLRHRLFKKNCYDKWLKEGKSPAREWLKVNGYPVESDELDLILFPRLLTVESAKEFDVLSRRFFLIYNNSDAFRKKCKARTKIENLALFGKHDGFKPVYNEDRSF